MATDTITLPTAADVDAAAKKLAGVAVRTPLLNFPVLDARLNARVFLKAETLQRTGSFKFRGAYNRISSIPQDSRAAGVVAYSSGNHAQGVAHAAALCDTPAVIVMPSDAPQANREPTPAPRAPTALDRKARVAGVRLYTAEHAGFDDTMRSFVSGKREKNPRMSGTICDALM